jgi:cytochrome b561
MNRYHPLLVSLHWIVAIMILVSLTIGGPSLSDIPNDHPDKLFGLTGHMIWGMVIGALLIVRLITRFVSRKPPAADTGNALLNLAGKSMHWALYLLALAMVATGLATAWSAGLFGIVFGGSGAPLPADFSVFTPRVAHGIIANLLLALIALHVLGWAFHQFVIKDKLISRMWFGARKLN